MKFTANRTAVVRALAAVGPACAGRTTSPILKLCKVEAGPSGDLTFSATDTEIGLRFTVAGAAVHRPGACLVDPARLGSLLKGSDAAEVDVAADGKSVLVKSGRGKFTLPAADVLAFPAVEDAADGPAWTVAAGVLLDLVARGAFAAELVEGRTGACAGTLLEFDGGRVRMASTDARTLTVCDGAADPSGDGAKHSVVLPPKALANLAGVLSDRAEPVRVAVGGGRVVFATGRGLLAATVMAARFQAGYELVLAAKLPRSAALPVPQFSAAVGQAAQLADEQFRRLTLAFAPGRLVVAAANANTGSGEVVIELADYMGPEVSLLLDSGGLKELVTRIDRAGFGVVTADFKNPSTVILFRAGDQWQAAMMPMVVN